MYCPKCGHQNPDDARFCMQCRADLESLRNSAGKPARVRPGAASGQFGRPSGRKADRLAVLGLVAMALLAGLWLAVGNGLTPSVLADAAGAIWNPQPPLVMPTVAPPSTTTIGPTATAGKPAGTAIVGQEDAASPAAAPAPTAALAVPTKAPTLQYPPAPTAVPMLSPTPAPAAAPTSGQPNVRIGLVAPMSGDMSPFGRSTENGFDLAVAEANATGKLKITTVVGDDKNDATEGVNVATKEITQDKVNAIVGAVSSKVSIPVSEVAQANKVVMITGTATNPKVTVDNGKRKDYVFRACFIDPFQGHVMAKFVTDTLKLKRAAIVYDNANDYSKGLATVFQNDFKSMGGTVTNFEAYTTNDTDFSAILTKIAANKPDFLYIPDYYNKVNLIAAQARQNGITAVLGGGDGWDSPDLDMKITDGSYFSNHYSPDATSPMVKDWVKKYQAKYGSVPDALATLAYDATNLLTDAIVRAGSNDPAKIRDALASTNGFGAVTGPISFDADGDPIKPAVMMQIKGGRQVYLATVNP